MYYRIRIIHVDTTISVRDYAFSQVVAMLKGMSEETKDKFWNKESVIAPNGENLKFVKEV